MNSRTEGYLYLLGFALCIPLANWMIGNVGTVCPPKSPCLIPVAPGIMAPQRGADDRAGAGAARPGAAPARAALGDRGDVRYRRPGCARERTLPFATPVDLPLT